MRSINGTKESGDDAEWAVLCIGAGLSGVYTTYRLRQLGLRGKILEAGSAEGGTWYWNRYPGARFDSESYSYQYFFDQELMNEYHWEEHFAGQPEILRYINYVVDKHDLRKDMQFNTRIAKAQFDEQQRKWTLTDEHGERYTSRWLILAVGILTSPVLPNIPGVSDFEGEAFHTARWPKKPVNFEGKRVGIIGTGATGIQAIQEIARSAGHLTVFQRRPNWACPMHNAKIDAKEMEEIRQGYPRMMDVCASSGQGFLHPVETLKTTDVSPEERDRVWETLYNTRGFGIWFSNFADVHTDREANNKFNEFLAAKIRQRVKDPETAEKLIPRDHGFATRRVPLETKYFEVYNQPNVSLVSVKDHPIERVTATGVQTSAGHTDLDMLIYATGFDAVTGSLDAIEIRGTGGERLVDQWDSTGPRTYLGLAVQKFPNIIEFATEWITDALRYFDDQGITYAEAPKECADEWTQHVKDVAEGALINEVDSWMTGINHNVGKSTRYVARYSGSIQQFRQVCNGVKENKYSTFKLA